MNSKNEISSTLLQKPPGRFKDYFRVISRVNIFSKFNDYDKNLEMIKFLTQFDSNIHNHIQSFIIMINLNDITEIDILHT